MNTNTGVACQCSTCGGPQWYDQGVCQGCTTDKGIASTWVGSRTLTGGNPEPEPANRLWFKRGTCDELLKVWTNLVLLRGLSPYMASPGQSFIGYRSAPWYRVRDVDIRVEFTVPTDPGFPDRLKQAGNWANQSLLVRIMATLEARTRLRRFSDLRLPNEPGMREFHHARNLRNKIAHGSPLTGPKLVAEAKALLGLEAVHNGECSLDISTVLEPIWARLYMYAYMIEKGPLLPRPAVVVAVGEDDFLALPFGKTQPVPCTGTRPHVGEVITLPGSELGAVSPD